MPLFVFQCHREQRLVLTFALLQSCLFGPKKGLQRVDSPGILFLLCSPQELLILLYRLSRLGTACQFLNLRIVTRTTITIHYSKELERRCHRDCTTPAFVFVLVEKDASSPAPVSTWPAPALALRRILTCAVDLTELPGRRLDVRLDVSWNLLVPGFWSSVLKILPTELPVGNPVSSRLSCSPRCPANPVNMSYRLTPHILIQVHPVVVAAAGEVGVLRVAAGPAAVGVVVPAVAGLVEVRAVAVAVAAVGDLVLLAGAEGHRGRPRRAVVDRRLAVGVVDVTLDDVAVGLDQGRDVVVGVGGVVQTLRAAGLGAVAVGVGVGVAEDG